MADFELTRSSMTEAAKTIRLYCENFKDQADETRNAAIALGQTWTGEASQKFQDSIARLNYWANQMAETLKTYADALDKADVGYADADSTSAKAFKK